MIDRKSIITEVFHKVKMSEVLSNDEVSHVIKLIDLLSSKEDEKAEMSLDVRDENRDTLLHCAAFYNHVEIAKKLLSAKANPNLTCINGMTATLWAASRGHSDIVAALIEAKADLNALSLHKDTALIWASYRGDVSSVKYLLEAGANTELMDARDKTALDWAVANQWLMLVELLLEHGAIIKQPDKLYDFLVSYDQRDTDVLSVLRILHQQQTHLRELGPDIANRILLEEPKYQQLVVYLQTLSNLSIAQRQLCDKRLDDATLLVIPKELRSIVAEYDNPLSHLGLFAGRDAVSKMDIEQCANDMASTPAPK